MATSNTIPSKLNAVTSVTAGYNGEVQGKLYITAILKSTTLNVDSAGGVAYSTPLTLVSPLRCSTFTATAAGDVAYYELSH